MSQQPDQDRIVDFFASGQAFDGIVPEHIETHISHIFLTGNRAYKLKRAIDLGFLDFTRLDQRRDACEREVVLNRRGAPGLYLRPVPVTETGGKLVLGGKDKPVEWLVEMRRFDQANQLDRLAESGDLTTPVISSLAERLIAFHQEIDLRPDRGGADIMLRTARTVAGNLERYGNGVLDEDALATWGAGIDFALSHETSLLNARRDHGFVRQCHGDLHLGNICVHEGKPLLFDCIEFNDEIACIDVLYDLAFLCMDLIYRGLPDHANLVLNRYLSATRDFEGLRLWPAFLSLRAAVRAMTGIISLETETAPPAHTADEARSHLALALRLLENPVPRLIAIGGLSGSGKSTLARALATQVAPGAGAVVVSSDVVRKRLQGVTPEMTLPKDAYALAVSEQTYRRLFQDVDAALHARQTVIADATFIREEDRAQLAELATGYGMPFAGLWLDAPLDVLKQRVDARTGDVSDADAAVIDTQRSQSLGTIEWSRVDATVPALFDESLAILQM